MVNGFKFMLVRLVPRGSIGEANYGENVLHSISLQGSRLGFHAACLKTRCRLPASYPADQHYDTPNAKQPGGVREAASWELGFLELLLEKAIQPIQGPRPLG